jgi:site-specific DNA-methyltransferase (adenine-specific)
MRIEKRNEFSFYHADCMQVMRETPDKYYELCIVDPPYGINRSKNFGMKEFGWVQHKRSEWDNAIPTKEYFDELKRVSKNQIIWGGNYMVEHLPPSMGWIFWDKGQRDFSTSDGELAYTSFQRKLKVFEMSRGAALANNGGKTMHPTQKPVQLYSWILSKYAKQGDKILDTHGGSMSIALAVDKANKLDNMNLSLTVIELDEEYFNAALHRFDNGQLQQTLNF